MMAADSRHRRTLWPPLLAVILSTAAACQTEGSADDVGAATEETSVVDAPVATEAPATTRAAMIRDADVTDIAVLSEQMAESAEGDTQWIAILADLRSRSWLAARYPGEYELTEIYSPEWAANNTAIREEESLRLGLYIDEPLPILESVVMTRELGQIVELEVVLRSEQAVVRRVDDDSIYNTLPGGRNRGLFSLGPSTTDDTDRPWRIHSVTELTPPEDPTPSTSLEANE